MLTSRGRRLLGLLWLSLAASTGFSTEALAQATACAATPDDAWRLAREAVATKDAGNVMTRLSPAYQTQNSVETAVGASMVAEIGGLSGGMSSKPGAAAKAKAAETQLLAELDGILKKYKAPTIKEIGTPLMAKMRAPDVLAKFAPINHVAFAREMEAFFAKVEVAAKAAGVSGESPKLDELVVGSGDLNAPLTGLEDQRRHRTGRSGSGHHAIPPYRWVLARGRPGLVPAGTLVLAELTTGGADRVKSTT